MKNYIYRLTCIDDRGWAAAGPDGLWGDLVEPEDRLFPTAREARQAMKDMLNAGCWSFEDEDGDTVEDRPVLAVERVAVYEYLWGDHDESVTDRVIDLHGGPIKFDKMPTAVAAYLVDKYTGAKHAWARESARLAGASSATHTAAFISARFSGRVIELVSLLRSRGIEAVNA